MSDRYIEFRNIHKAFGDFQVLKGVNLCVKKGETMVILGASGSGKSVLIRHTIGLLSPDDGSVIVDGESIEDYSEQELQHVRKKVAMLFQRSALFDSMSVFENVAFSLYEHTKMTEDEIVGKVAEKLGLVGLSGVEDKMPADLSGGMQKRVALARAIALEPCAILYDEPTTGLDPITARKIDDLIIDMQKVLNVTSIVVTHDIESAFTVADRVALLYKGQMVFVGTVDEIKNTDNPLVREFISGGREEK